MTDAPGTPGPATAVARAAVEALAGCGVRHVVLAPGSRSAPLAYALAAAERAGLLRLYVRVDERVAGFTALGLARGSDGPAAVVTTSGTAVANLHPAVLEASHAGVPLLVISADRPHELRGVAASQTTEQRGIFGTAARAEFELAAPAGVPGEARDAAALLARAVALAAGARTADPGPVHVNMAFRDPLVPGPGEWRPAPLRPGAELPDIVPLGAPAPGPVAIGGDTVVVAGDGAGRAARDFAETARLPLLAGPTSGARTGRCAVGPYRLLLDSALGQRIRRAVVFGHPTLSRPVTHLLARPDVEVTVVAPRGAEFPDATRTARRVVPGAVPEGTAPASWLGLWQRAAALASTAVEHVLAGAGTTGQSVAAAVWRVLGPGDVLMLGSSSAVRDADLVGTPFGRLPGTPEVVANRGLAGIDGTLSTAFGHWLGRQETGDRAGRLRVLLGDLAFLHDAGALSRTRGETLPAADVVVVNDQGGGLFHTLEHGRAEHAADFERVFGTAQQADLGALAAGYGWAHEVVDDPDLLAKRLAEPAGPGRVLEVPVDRSRRRALDDAVHDAVRAAVRDLA